MNNTDITIIIDGRRCQAAKGEPALKVAKREGIDIPAFCFHESLAPFGACRLCIVEVVAGGRPGLTTSCTLAATDGLEIRTDTEEVALIRKGLLELYLAQAPDSDYVQELAASYGVTESRFASAEKPADQEKKCVLCGLCSRVCNESIGAGVINFIGRGPETEINSPYLEPSDQCIGCTACADICPTGAVSVIESDGLRRIETWSGTEVTVIKCRMCGRDCAPDPLIEVVYREVPDLADELKDVCPVCRRRLKTRKYSHLQN